jgi:uncharacterized repeat protein (TIGR03803 family)
MRKTQQTHHSTSPKQLRAGSAVLLAIPLFCLLFATSSAQAQTYKVLYRFTGNRYTSGPIAGVIVDSAGNIYGTTQGGGSFNVGAVFRIDPQGKETVLHNFWGGDGIYPNTRLIPSKDGSFYGTTDQGGAPKGGACTHGCGTVFRLDSNGKLTVLYVFKGGSDGREPSGLTRDQQGKFYGTTSIGGNLNCDNYNPGCGVVFELKKTGEENALFTFDLTDGTYPEGLIRDDAGNLYGVASGGVNNYGVVYKVDPTGHETVLYNFTDGTDGGVPEGPLLRDAAGNLYGETVFGGNLTACGGGQYKGCGVVFKLDSASNETVLYTFTGQADGAYPNGGLTQDSVGNFYGATGDVIDGCGVNCGTIFKLDPSGHETVLHTFSGGRGGMNPFGGVTIDASGNLYGTTFQGGDLSCGYRGYGCGLVFKLSP